jgi:pimeloyl-ACP methyl ester carboxylesterase
VTTFVLVHGAWHGSWCWELLERELEARGARPATVDLPTEDTRAGATRYAELVAEECDRAEGQLVVVGHSLAGVVLPRVARLRPVESLVFVCGAVPLPGHSFAEQFSLEGIKREPDMHATVSDANGLSSWRDREVAIEAMYHDAPREVAEWAATRLRRQARAAPREPFPEDGLPVAARCAYVLCREDRLFDPEWMRDAARDRLGAEPVELDGGHCPMLSRPGELADLLLSLAS